MARPARPWSLRMRTRYTMNLIRLLFCIFCCQLIHGADQFQFLSSLEGFKPTHSGLLITEVLAKSQAERLGLKQGDIIVSYNNTNVETLHALAEAKKAVADGIPSSMVIQRDKGARNIDIIGGSIGCHIYEVKAGQAIRLRPPATKCMFELQRLADQPAIFENWYAFSIDGKHVGYEHISLEHVKEQSLLRSKSEVAFDGGKQWGLNHFVVTVECDDKAPFKARSVNFHTPLSKFTANSKRITRKTEHWETTFNYIDERGQKQQEQHRILLPDDGVPSYVVLQLASLLEREPGACFHFTSLVDGTGERGMPSALIVDKRETLNLNGKDIDCTRCDNVSLQGSSSAWIDDHNRIIKMQFGPNTFATLSSKAEATKNIDERIKPQP